MTDEATDLHNTKLRELRSTNQTLPSTDERWNTYLDTLPQRDLTNADVAEASRKIWQSIRKIVPAMPPPDASPTSSKGILMSWDASGRHLEIEILPNTSYEWFYRERKADISEGGDEPTVDTLSDQLVARLRNV